MPNSVFDQIGERMDDALDFAVTQLIHELKVNKDMAALIVTNFTVQRLADMTLSLMDAPQEESENGFHNIEGEAEVNGGSIEPKEE